MNSLVSQLDSLNSNLIEYKVPTCFRDQNLKWNGWGYVNSFFTLSSLNEIYMKSENYQELNEKVIPNLCSYIEKNLGVELSYKTPSKNLAQINIPASMINTNFFEFLRKNDISFTNSNKHRLMRCHGQTLHEILALRNGDLNALGKIPDLVIWPKSECDVEKIVQEANRLNIVLIPIGGGTCVSDALSCSINEKRITCSVDMTLMNKIHWIDEKNFLCCVEAGVLGQHLESQLNKKGFTCGHEPDSMEFSSLGGWISTRASGMKKNKYGNIEDLLVQVKLITSKGILSRHCKVPRISAGPDLQQIVLGSEGSYGIITEAIIKIFHLPECQKFGSIIFPTFQNGLEFVCEVAKKKWQCASLRLVDNQQFQMGQAMKMQSKSIFQTISSNLAKLYITKWKNFDIEEMVVATCVFEGTKEDVDQNSKRLYHLAKKFNGIEAGEENGRYGYRLTFAIAYLRDLAMEYSVIGESFETSIAWEHVAKVCSNVKQVLKNEAERYGIKYPVIATSRVTQVYDVGACVYFYFAFNYRGLKGNPAIIFEKIETAARDEIIACGGSISHHHGVGKLRKKWLTETVGTVGVELLKSLKNELDSKNIFACNNLIEFEKKDVNEKSKI